MTTRAFATSYAFVSITLVSPCRKSKQLRCSRGTTTYVNLRSARWLNSWLCHSLFASKLVCFTLRSTQHGKAYYLTLQKSRLLLATLQWSLFPLPTSPSLRMLYVSISLNCRAAVFIFVPRHYCLWSCSRSRCRKSRALVRISFCFCSRRLSNNIHFFNRAFSLTPLAVAVVATSTQLFCKNR